MYRIKSHPAIATAAAGTLTLYDSVVSAIDAGPVSLSPNLFNAVKVGSAALAVPVGVAPIDVTTGNYFWLQTWGPATVKHSAATPAAAAIAMATLGRAGAYSITGTLAGTGFAAVDYQVVIGKNLSLAATATEALPVLLTILP